MTFKYNTTLAGDNVWLARVSFVRVSGREKSRGKRGGFILPFREAKPRMAHASAPYQTLPRPKLN